MNAVLKDRNLKVTELSLHGAQFLSELVFLKVLLSKILNLNSRLGHGLGNVLILLNSKINSLVMELKRVVIGLLTLMQLFIDNLIMLVEFF